MSDFRARGFSILELLLTLAIVLCLAAFLAPSVRPADKAADILWADGEFLRWPE